MPKVSVIIPVYNTEKYLTKCLESACQQTLADIEIICINDCSTDNSLQILQEFAEKDRRIKIIEFTENKGAAAARNTGIEAATGEYTAFLDSDDYIDLDFYEKLYCAAAEANADCAKGNYKDAVTGYVDPLLNQKIEEYQTNFAYAYCSAIFKRAVIQNNAIKFPVLIDMEDPVFTLNFALLMNKIVIVNDACIHILRREDSSTSGIPTFERIKAKFKGLEIILDIANSVNMPKESYAYILAFWFQQTFANSIINKNSKERAFIAENIASLYNKITVKELFIKKLMQKDEVLVDGLKNNDKKLLMQYGCNTLYNKSIFLSLRNKIKTAANPKISVVIPVYNAKDYLERCLDSVCNQTLKELEIICVNDCSTDNSLEILNKYAQNDKRIIVIDCTVNGGESKARNLGIEKASGEFIAFVDNDDKIDLDFYEKLYQKAKETNADIVKGNVITIDYDNISHPSLINPIIGKTKNKWCFHYEWWSAIYKTNIIKENNITLPEGCILGGDVLFLNEILFYANKLELVDDVAYYWIRRENSGESLVLSKEKMASALSVYDKIQTNINTWYINRQIDAESYDSITKNCLWLPGNYIFRNNQAECKELCAEYYIVFYQNCMRKNAAKKYLQEEVPYLISSIINNNKEELYNKILKIKDREDLRKKNRFAGLRNKTRKVSPKVSVIIPVYNVERYLARCLESVINQTYKDVEIICVNDCSPDNSAEILEKYAKKDNRIKIINRKQNGGPSAARNTGLDVATGEYVYFIDSDDWIDLDYIEKMVEKIEKSNCDIVLNTNIVQNTDDSEEQYIWNRYKKQNNEGEYIDKYNAIHKTPCMIWAHLYKKSFLDTFNLRFPESYIYEDEYFQYTSLLTTENLFVFYGAKYHYYKNTNSIMQKNKSRTVPSIRIWELVYEYLRNNNVDFSKLRLFIPSTVLSIADENEYIEVKKFLHMITPVYKKQRNLYMDYENYQIDLILNALDFDDYLKKKKNIFINYFMRLKTQRQKNIKVSIIIPVYNVADYLERCLDSVCNQTLRDIEIICINDCSPDNSLDILKEYAKSDNRIKVIDFKENKGVAIARNEGIKQAKGEYIGFVDSDDYVDLDFYEKLYNNALNQNADIAIANHKNVSDSIISDAVDYNKKAAVNKIHFNGFFWLGIYRSKIIKEHFDEIKFNENLKYGEDRIFPIGACYYSNRIVILDDVYYYYYQRNYSATKEYHSNKEKLMDFLNSSKMILDYFNTLNYSSADYFLFYDEYIEYILGTFNCALMELKHIPAEIFNYYYENVKFPNDRNMLKYKNLYMSLKDNDYCAFKKYYTEFQSKKIFMKLRKKITARG